MKKRISIIFQVSLSVGLIFAVLYFNKIEMSEIGEVLGKLKSYHILIYIIPILIVDRILMSYKWNLLLRATGVEITLWDNIKLYMASGFIGLALPSTIGADFIRTYKLSRNNFEIKDILASVVVERAFGFFSVELFAFITGCILLWYNPEVTDIVLTVFSIMAVMFLVFFAMSSKKFSRILRRFIPLVIGENVMEKITRFFSAFSVYREKPRVIIDFISLTLAETFVPIVLSIIFSYYLQLNIDWFVLFLVVPIILIVIRIPVTLNGVGLIEGIYVVLLGRFGVSAVDAFTLGIMMDVTGIFLSLSGGIFLWSFFMKKSAV